MGRSRQIADSAGAFTDGDCFRRGSSVGLTAMGEGSSRRAAGRESAKQVSDDEGEAY